MLKRWWAFSLTSQLGLRAQPASARAPPTTSFLGVLITGIDPREIISEFLWGPENFQRQRGPPENIVQPFQRTEIQKTGMIHSSHREGKLPSRTLLIQVHSSLCWIVLDTAVYTSAWYLNINLQLSSQNIPLSHQSFPQKGLGCSLVEEHMPSMHKLLGWIPSS